VSTLSIGLVVSHLTEEVAMSSIPKVVGALSCAFLLCLGLSGTAALAADDMQLGKSGERIGGQSGHRGDEDKLQGIAGDSSGKRIGGQSGHRGDEDKLKGVAVDSAGKRIGGQSGHRGDEDKLKRSPMKK
jgi:hypothetical protein